MKLFELFATLGLDTSGFDKDVKGAQGKMSGLASSAGNAVKGVGKGAISVGKAAVSAAGSIIDTMQKAVTTIAVTGGGAMVALGTKAVTAAADIAAETAAFDATFGTIAEEAKSAYSVIGEQANILDTRLQKTATKGFSQLKGAGLSANEALEASSRLLTLAADGAAYYDTSLENVDERLRSFLRGNVEAGDSIGLFTSELQRNNKAQELYKKKWDKLTEAQRQMVMLNIAEEIYEQSGVIGQAARESEGWANVIENLKESWRQTLGVIGMPIMDSLTPVIQEITTYLVQHKDDLQGFAGNLGDIVELLTTGHEAEAIQAASGMINGFLDQFSALTADGEMWQKGQEIFDALRTGFSDGIERLKPIIGNIAKNIGPWIVEYNGDLLVGGLELITGIANGLVENKEQLGQSFGQVLKNVTSWVSENGADLVSAGIQLLVEFGAAIVQNAPSLLWEAGKAIVKGLFDAFSTNEEENPLIAEIDEAFTQMWNLQKEVDGIQQQYEAMMASEQAIYSLALKHLETVERISSQEIKTDEDMRELQNAIVALNTLYPELNLSIDEQTGAITDSTAAIRDKITALRELALEEAKQYQTEQFKEKIGPAYDAQLQAEKNLEQATAAHVDAQKELNSILALQPEPDGKWKTEYDSIDGLVLKSIEGLDKFFEYAADGSAKVKDDFIGASGEITKGAAAEIAAYIQAAADESQELVDELEEAKQTAQETAQAANDAVEKIITEYQGNIKGLEEMLHGAMDSISTTPDTSGIEGASQEAVSSLQSLESQANQTAAAIHAAFASAANTPGAPSGGGFFGKHAATGLERVPYDGFGAILHKDEMVLSKNDAKEFRKGNAKGGNQGGVTVVQNIQAVPQTASELAFQTMNALEMLRFST